MVTGPVAFVGATFVVVGFFVGAVACGFVAVGFASAVVPSGTVGSVLSSEEEGSSVDTSPTDSLGAGVSAPMLFAGTVISGSFEPRTANAMPTAMAITTHTAATITMILVFFLSIDFLLFT